MYVYTSYNPLSFCSLSLSFSPPPPPPVGPSMDSSGINIVDCVRIYTKTKEEFGFPERPLTPGLSLSAGGRVFGEDERGDKELLQPSETQRLGPVDR